MGGSANEEAKTAKISTVSSLSPSEGGALTERTAFLEEGSSSSSDLMSSPARAVVIDGGGVMGEGETHIFLGNEHPIMLPACLSPQTRGFLLGQKTDSTTDKRVLLARLG